MISPSTRRVHFVSLLLLSSVWLLHYHCHQCAGQYLVPGNISNFESPYQSSYQYTPPQTSLQPWLFDAQGGIATLNSPWQCGNPIQAPTANQYAYLQSTPKASSNMSTTVTNLLLGQSYNLSFFYSVRAGSGTSTYSTLYVYWRNSIIWQSAPNIAVAGGYVFINCTLVASATSGTLTFSNQASTGTQDRALLFDSVLLEPASYNSPTWIYVYQPGVPQSFELPNLNPPSGLSQQPYYYNPPISTTQPWTWTLYQGGNAIQGSPWDPPGSNIPPMGLQYAFIQCYPAGQGSANSNMSTIVSGLVPGQYYQISFYLSTRKNFATVSQLTIWFNNVNIWQSVPNYASPGGWAFFNTSVFSLPVGGGSSAPLVFAMVPTSAQDGAFLVDGITMFAATATPTITPYSPPFNYPLVYTPNPCTAASTSPWPSLVFPEYYASAYMYSPAIPANASSPFYNPTNGLTIQFWLNIARTGQSQAAAIMVFGAVTFPSTAGSRINITWNSADQMVFDIGGSDSCASLLSYASLRNVWNLWTFTYSNSSGATTRYIYLNGTQVCFINSPNTIKVSASSHLFLGNQPLNASATPGWNQNSMTPINLVNALPGYLADFRVYQRVLTTSEMILTASTGVHLNNSNLALSYQFKEQSSIFAYDSSGSTYNLTLEMNAVSWYNFMQQQPQWSGYYLQPLCLYSPTTLQVSGPTSSPTCQATNSPFIVSVSVLDQGGNVVTSYNGVQVSLILSAASSGATYVSISPNSATFVNGVASFTVSSSVAQTITLASVDSGNLKLLPTNSTIAIQPLSGVYFNNTQFTSSALAGTGQAVTVYAGACSGGAVAMGSAASGVTVELAWTSSTALNYSSPRTITLTSSGYGFLWIQSSTAASAVFSFVDLWNGAKQLGSSVTMTWTGSTIAAVVFKAPYAASGQQPSASTFYTGSSVVVPVFAVDSLGGLLYSVANNSFSVTVVVQTSSINTTQLVSLNAGVGYVQLTALTSPGIQYFFLLDTSHTNYTMGASLSVQTVVGMVSALVISPPSTTATSGYLTTLTATNTLIVVTAVDMFGNPVTTFSGKVIINSSSSTSLINKVANPTAVSLVNGTWTGMYYENVTSTASPVPVVLNLLDTFLTGLNVSSTLTILLQSSSSTCANGTRGSGAVNFQSNAAGILHNTGDLVNFGGGDFTLLVYAYVLGASLYAGPNYFASQSYYPPGYNFTGSQVWNSLFVGPDQVPEVGGMTFDMCYYTTNNTYPYYLSYNDLSVGAFSQYGQWVHWAFTFTSSSGSQQIYYNGVLVGQRIGQAWSLLGQLLGSWQLGMAPITSAANQALYSFGFNYGNLMLDDLRIYTRVVTQAELTQIVEYNVYANTANLYMHYAFDEGGGVVMHDSVNHFDVYGYNNGVGLPTWSSNTPNCLPTTSQVVILTNASCALGTTLIVTLQAQDVAGVASVSFKGRAQLVVSDTYQTLSMTPSSGIVTFVLGVATVQLTDTLPETASLSLVDLDGAGLKMTSTAQVLFYAGQTAALVFYSVPSQQAGSGLGSTVVIRCYDTYGNPTLTGCSGSVTMLFNSSHVTPGSLTSPNASLAVQLNPSSGMGSISLVDSAVETVKLTLRDDYSLGFNVSSTALMYSTGSPVALTARFANTTNTTTTSSVDNPVTVIVSVVDAHGTFCGFVTDHVVVTVHSATTNLNQSTTWPVSAGVADVLVRSTINDTLRVTFSGSTYSSPTTVLTVVLSVGQLAQIVLKGATWPGSLLKTTSSATVTVAAEDQYGNAVVSYNGGVTVQCSGSAIVVSPSQGSSIALAIISGAATLVVNDTTAQTVSLTLSNATLTNSGISMGNSLSLSFASGACVQYVVNSVFGSAYYDFPAVSPGTGAFKSWPAGSLVPFNTSQNIQVTIQCQSTTGSIDISVQSIQLSLSFSHNQTAIINGNCTMVNGTCIIYFQSYAAGNMTFTVTDVGTSKGFTMPAATKLSFTQNVPLVWSVTGQQQTTDGSTIVNQYITLTGQTFMCGQNFSQPPVIQLSDSVTGLVANCPVTFFNSTMAVCLLPAGQGEPEMIIYVCGTRQLHLPMWASDWSFSAFGFNNQNCISLYNVWDLASHEWANNVFCSSTNKALIDMRFYQPPFLTTVGYSQGSVPLPNYVLPYYPSVPAEVNVTHQCVQLEEINEPWGWPSTFFCIPKLAPYSLTLSRVGQLAGDACAVWRDASDPYWSDGNHDVCAPTGTPYPNSIQLYYYAAPIITSITPSSANCTGNVTITLRGTSFGLASHIANGPNTVTVGSSTCVINTNRYNHTYAECEVPAGMSATNAVVMTVEGVVSTSTNNFAYLPPVITNIVPATGLTQGGDLITIYGYNFGFSTATATIAGATCNVQSNTNTVITCTTPAGSGTYQSVYVTAVGSTTSFQSNINPYYWSYSAPMVYGVTPSTYDSAGQVTLTVVGSSFGANSATTTVNGNLCGSLTLNHTYITCTLPAGQGYNLTVAVVQSGQTSSPSGVFSYNPPNITQNVSPQGAASGSGQYLTLTGLSFGVSGTVTVNGLNCDWTSGGSWQHHQILCALPAGSGANVPVQVQVGGQVSNNVTFSYTPVINGTMASSLYTQGGTPLTLIGSGFNSPSVVNDTVLVNGYAVCAVISQTETQIVCTLPPGQGTGNAVQVQGQFSLLSSAFTFSYSAPAISSQVPALSPAAGGINITLTGTSFGYGNATTLTINSVSANILFSNHTAIVFTAPSGSGVNEPLIVKVAGQVSATMTFPYIPPNITAITPTTGRTVGGYPILLFGSSFGSGTVVPIVSIGGTLVTIVARNDTFINVTCPIGQGTVAIYVILDGQVSNTVSFRYDPPSLSTITPANGPTNGNGTLITLTGGSFGTTGAVYFTTQSGSTQTCPTAGGGYGQQQIVCSLPAGMGTNVSVTVLSGGQTSNALNFSYNPPSVTSILPNHAVTDGGSIITISGSSFGQSGIVTLAGAACAQAGPGTTYTDSLIECQLAAGQGTGYNLNISVSGQSINLPSVFNYDAPSISSIVPAYGPSVGGTTLTVNGINFGSVATVTFNGTLGSLSAQPCAQVGLGQSNEQITCTVPSNQGPFIPLYVTVSGQQSSPAYFSYNAPSIVSVTPQLANTDGSTAITMRGASFGIGYNYTLALNRTHITPSIINDSTILFTMPAGTGTNLPLALVVATQAATYSGGSLVLSYSPPTIAMVRGCASFSGAVATQCDTGGLGMVIAITGTNFGNNVNLITITTGGLPCTPVVIDTPNTRINCTLAAAPSGGYLVAVNVIVAGQSVAEPYLSYAGPTISAGTLTLANKSMPSSNLTVDDPLVSLDVITFQGQYWSSRPSDLTVTYGLPGQSKLYVCGNVSVVVLDDSSSLYALNCTVQVGVGEGLVFVVQAKTLTSAEGTDTLSYPTPVILNNTIHANLGTLSALYVGDINPGDVVLFNVLYVGTSASLLSIYMAQSSSGPFTQQCASVGIVFYNTSFTTLQCTIPQGSGDSWVFQIVALNAVSLPGTDVYDYPQSPIVYSVNGCQDSFNTTAMCATVGGTYVTVDGEYFDSRASHLSVRIGSNPCSSIIGVSEEQLLCEIESGSGYNQSVTVTKDQQSSLPVSYLSYAPATVTSVSGCTDSGNNTLDCARDGGTIITIRGSNFGPIAPLVLIGGEECTNVVEGSDALEDVLYCSTPSGYALDLPLIVVQSGGPVTATSSVQLSYLPCGAGSYQSATDSTCINCPSGEYQPSTGTDGCEQCPAGSIPSADSTSCIQCPAGAISAAGDSVCTNCTAGSYTPSPGYSACVQCGVGTYSNMTAATTCNGCSTGTASSALAATSCTACSAGLYADFEGALTCSPCPAGTESTTLANAGCTACAAGYSSSASSATCTPCGIGYYSSTAGTESCVACDSGTFGNSSGLSACDSCAVGTYSLKNGDQGPTICTACAAGTYIDVAGQSACLSCSFGTYAPNTQSSQCSACPAGYYSSTAPATSCQPCAAGTYSSINGTVTCSSCPAGTYSPVAGMSSCTACSAGTYQPTPGQSLCLGCLNGTAMASTGQQSCVACAAGTYGDSGNLESCAACPVGEYSVKVAGAGAQQCSLCPAGSFSATTGQDTCQACPIGYYSDTDGQSECIKCPAGTAATTTGMTTCTNCTAGSYSPIDGSYECTACPVGSYSSADQSTECTACPLGTAVSYTGATGCPVCDNGYYASNTGQGSCTACQSGTYGPDSFGVGLSSCDVCPAGSAQPSAYATSCSLCTAGTFQAADGQGSCTQCAAGTYTAVANSTVCSSCPAGTAAPSAGSTLCTGCAAGSYSSSSGSGSCFTCPAGSYSTGSASRCTQCTSGYYAQSAGATSCQACPIGQYATTTGAAACSPCPTGTFTSNVGTATCLSCPIGSYQPATGQTNCTLCANGTYTAVVGSDSCSTCALGSYPTLNGVGQQQGSTACTACPLGTYLPSSLDTCLSCIAGTYAPLTGQTACTLCASGSFTNAPSATACTLCSAGQYQPSTNSTGCLDCPSGSYGGADGLPACTLCAMGTASNDTALTSICDVCQPGTYANSQGQTACLLCDVGTEAPATQADTCTACAAGYYSDMNGTVSCSQCAAGTYQPSQGASACIECPVGQAASSNGSLQCSPCPVGTYSNETGLAQCNPCDTGTVQPSTGTTECVLCDVGNWQPYAGQSACLLCGAGTYTDVNGTETCTNCPEGQYQTDTGQTGCDLCAQGTYNPNTQQTSCQSCSAGSYSNTTGAEECAQCAAGYYQTQPSSTSCDPCPAGSYQPNTGASTCIRCQPGQYNDEEAAITCSPCAAGTIQTLTGQTNCTVCPVGSYSNTDGLTSCTQCLAGSYNPFTNQSSCQPCQAGTYQLLPGQALCDDCAAGTYQVNDGSTTCTPCIAGSYTNVNASESCEACDIGTYQSLTGQSGCELCPAGEYNDGTGAQACTLCAAGSYTALNGSTGCSSCPMSTYQSLQGQTGCTPCEAGTYTETSANVQCVQCAVGSYQNATGSTGCVYCAEGTYQNYLGQSTCTECAVGESNPIAGQSTCYVCSEGTYSAVNGSVTCPECAIGSVQPNKGSTSCELCSVGEYQGSMGSLSCTVCSAGQYAPANGSSICLNCPPGTYAASQGSSSCTACSAGYYNGNTKQTSCVACTRGTYTDTTGQSICADCGVGTYGDSDAQVSCPSCEAGYYAGNTHQTACDVCSEGSASSAGASVCSDCEPGSYQSLPGQANCSLCPAGQETGDVLGSVQCSPCQTGSYSLEGAVDCLPCGTGTYQPRTGNNTCLACPTGTYSSVTGASSCSDCGLGSFGNVTGLQSCFDCPIGTNQPLTGQTSCTLCDVGTYTSFTATHNCYLCPIGTNTSVNGSTKCASCSMGYYQDTAGQSACKACLSGDYTDVAGSSYCKACPQGTKNSTMTAAQNCSTCPLGQYQDLTGQTYCMNCTTGTYAATTGLPQCTACPQGSYGTTGGQTVCRLCAAGYFQNNISSTTCDACGPGYYSGSGAASCSVCGSGQVTDESATVSCYACPAATTQPNFEQTMCICNAGYFMPNYTAGSNTFLCEVCPTGADCTQAGTNWMNLQSLPCYWRANNNTFNFYRCPICSACPGGLAAGSASENEDNLDNAGDTYVPVAVWDATATPCTANRGGILCSSCVDGYEEQTGGDCVPCPSGASSFVQDVVIAIVLVGLVVFSFWLMIRSDRHLFETFDRATPLSADEEEISNADVSRASADSGLDSDSDDSSSDDSDISSSDSESSGSSNSSSSSRSKSRSTSASSQHTSQKSRSKRDATNGAAVAGADGDHEYDKSASSVPSDSSQSSTSSDVEADEAAAEPSNAPLVTARSFEGPPAPAENLTYKLKIMLSFLQIATNLSSGLDITWPTLYKSFLLNFDIINFSSILGNVTSSECIGAVTYYREWLTLMLAPLIALGACIVLYLVPSHLDLFCFRRQTLQAKTRTRMKFWKLFLYCLFLVYPSLSSTVLRQHVCLTIDNTYWLLTNLRVQCYTSDWYYYSYVSIPFIILYPIGIPLFFFMLLASNRKSLMERRVQAQLGFLYASYQRQLWWWEILDSINKLFLTSILAFFPNNSQLPLAMGCISLYSMSILVLQPFLSPSDDLLQLLALTELFMLCLAGWIYYNTTDATLAGGQDTFVSVCLIAITILFFAAFMGALLWAMRKLVTKMYNKLQWTRQVQMGRNELAKLEEDRLKGKLQQDSNDVGRISNVPKSLAGAVDEKVAVSGAAEASKIQAMLSGLRTPGRSARVTPVVAPLKPLPVPTLNTSHPSARPHTSAADSDDSHSGSDSESGSGSDNESERRAPISNNGSKPYTQRGSRPVSRMDSSVDRKEGWSIPSTPKQITPLRTPTLANHKPTQAALISARLTNASSIPEEERDRDGKVEAKEEKKAADEDESESDDDEPIAQQLQAATRQRTLSPIRGRASLAARNSLAIGGDSATPAEMARRKSVVNPNRLQRQSTIAALAPIKKKRKVVRPGDNFRQNQAMAGLTASPLSPFKQLSAAFAKDGR